MTSCNMEALRKRAQRLVAVVLGAALLFALGSPVGAADPYVINVILPLTGRIAFVGATDQQALKALEAYVNKTGGIRGRQLSFAFADDQSDPKVSLQVAQGLIAKNVPIILGPSGPDTCAAIAPLVEQNGPFFYCLANAGHPTVGSYQFLTLFPYEPQFVVTLRYFRERGWHRLGYAVAADAGGQDAEKALLYAAGLPENKSIQIVAHEYYTPGDLSAAAQMERIKTAKPDVLVIWATGTAAGTMFRGAQDLNIDLPTATSPGNLNAGFFKQYDSKLPTDLLFASVPYYAGDVGASAATKAATATLTNSLAPFNAKPDMIEISAWDPGLIIVDALRKLGPDASAAKLKTYVSNLQNFTGVNGPYDFKSEPQRGLGSKNIVMVRYNNKDGSFTAVSKAGGDPLAGK
jgi:branched-chain amino acid transport system substrate-binding protein